jgi:DNA-binding transcriptional ArsR family regulator
MRVKTDSSPFGGQNRTRVLLALRLLGDSYPRELARLLEVPLSNVQKAMQGLEVDGLIAGRPVGRTRLYQLNPRYFAAEALFAYLSRLTEPEVHLQERVATVRRRPRRTGKPL